MIRNLVKVNPLRIVTQSSRYGLNYHKSFFGNSCLQNRGKFSYIYRPLYNFCSKKDKPSKDNDEQKKKEEDKKKESEEEKREEE